MKNKIVPLNSELMCQGIIHRLIAMLKIGCKIINIQNEERANKLVTFLIRTNDGTVRKNW